MTFDEVIKAKALLKDRADRWETHFLGSTGDTEKMSLTAHLKPEFHTTKLEEVPVDPPSRWDEKKLGPWTPREPEMITVKSATFESLADVEAYLA